MTSPTSVRTLRALLAASQPASKFDAGQRHATLSLTGEPRIGVVLWDLPPVLEVKVGEDLDLHRLKLKVSISLPSIRAIVSRP